MCSAMIRTITSLKPPAAAGTIQVMGFTGYSAKAGSATAKSAHDVATMDMNRRVIDAPPCAPVRLVRTGISANLLIDTHCCLARGRRGHGLLHLGQKRSVTDGSPAASFDHLVRAGQPGGLDGDTSHLCCLHVDPEFEVRPLINWQIVWFCSVENFYRE